MNAAPTLLLADGRSIPQLGLGTWKMADADAAALVAAALQTGYRHVDTAALYGNERGVGEGLRRSGLPRDAVFVTTKVWNDMQGYDRTLRAFDDSLKRLGLDAVDLYLIHWPAPRQDLYRDSWRALLRLKEQGRARSIGVSNFNAEQIDRLIGESGVTPVVNQVELHPRFQQRRLRAACTRRGIVVEAWSPLGRGALLADPVIVAVAEKHGCSPAQVILRWHVENGIVAIPKSADAGRMAANLDVFGWALDEDDRRRLDALDDPSGRIGPDPMTADF